VVTDAIKGGLEKKANNFFLSINVLVESNLEGVISDLELG